MTLKIEKLTAENTSHWGTLVNTTPVPAYKGEDFSFYKNIGTIGFSTKAGLSIVETYMDPSTADITWLEKHVGSKEVIAPTDRNVILVMGAGDKEPDLATVKALELEKGSAFVVNEGVWHCAPVSSGGRTNVFIVLDETTPDQDLVQVDVDLIKIES